MLMSTNQHPLTAEGIDQKAIRNRWQLSDLSETLSVYGQYSVYLHMNKVKSNYKGQCH